MKRSSRYGADDWIVIIIGVILILVVAYFITGCTASQTKQVHMRYQYDTTCTLTVTGAEQQTGNKLASGMELEGEDCIVTRSDSAEKN